MKIKKINKDRWKQAQKFEFDEWVSDKNIINDEWQELCHKFSKLFPKIAKKINLKKTDKILDVGCGPTVPSRLLGVGKIIGIEPLADKLKISGKNKVKGVDLIVNGMAESLPFKDNSFNLVVCRNVIDHTQYPEKIIKEIHRVLKRDGHLLLICYTYAPFITWIKNTSEKTGFLNNTGHPFTFTPNTLDNLVDKKLKIIDRYTIHTGIDSTDYGKKGKSIKDNSVIHKIIIWINKTIFMSSWFLKEYGYLAEK